MQPIEPQNADATPPAVEAMPAWGALDILIGLGLLIVMAVALVKLAPLPLRWKLTSLPRTEFNAALGVLGELVMLVPVWLIAVVWRRSSWTVVGFRRFKPDPGCLLPVVYMCGALAFMVSWGAVVKLMHWPTQVEVGDMFGSSPTGIAIGYLAVAVAAPLAEETFFRGFILGGLRRRLGTLGALLASATIFTAPHLPVSIYPAIFMLGLLLGLLFVQTKSLWPGILLHAAFNSISFAAQMACTLYNCTGP